MRIFFSPQPLYRELYTLNPATFFVHSFVKAFSASDKNKDESIRSIVSEPTPGVYTFDMLQPRFCEMLLSEILTSSVNVILSLGVKHPTFPFSSLTLEDILLIPIMDLWLSTEWIEMSNWSWEVPDLSLGVIVSMAVMQAWHKLRKKSHGSFHVDDSEVTLNVCLGKQFTGGELFFRDVRCEKHVNSETHPEELLFQISFVYCDPHTTSKLTYLRGEING
ncbi:hypothetical protein Ccrd_002227 [Cynara cardunculus var. scolymus]|uniref:Uncharacterized protein n=1 Tax=Cynara cardunculus var. scolymus TaxID=59895 RepID=A0A103XRS2_CYNCS|nr:hypothetical protein Ccrd_002227 [Cynara cardunculus var. scolymus]